ncbi:hypothetical protein CDEF62S_04461 [Castellaniella defragrans]
MMRSTLGLICLAALGTLPAFGATPYYWPATPKRTALETPYGTLDIRASDYVYGATLTFNHTPTIPRLQGILNIPYAYDVGRKQMALVSEDKGIPDCPVTYYWVVISEQGYRLSAPFGSCSADIRLTVHGTLLSMETPSRDDKTRLDIWTFNGQKIRKRTTHR